jgi:hypothetical protein
MSGTIGQLGKTGRIIWRLGGRENEAYHQLILNFPLSQKYRFEVCELRAGSSLQREDEL